MPAKPAAIITMPIPIRSIPGTYHMQTGEQIAACTETWVDVLFKDQGTVRAGVDCKGLAAGVGRECGRPEASSLEALAGDYDLRRPVDARRLKAGLARLFDKVLKGERQPGDILLCILGGRPQHLAIYCPKDGKPNRAIEAMPHGPGKVRPAHWPLHRIDSVWRWRD